MADFETVSTNIIIWNLEIWNLAINYVLSFKKSLKLVMLVVLILLALWTKSVWFNENKAKERLRELDKRYSVMIEEEEGSGFIFWMIFDAALENYIHILRFVLPQRS